MAKWTWNPIVLSAGQAQVWWHEWGYASTHHIRVDANPDSDQSSIKVTDESSEKKLNGTIRRYVKFTNVGKTAVQFRPTAIKQ